MSGGDPGSTGELGATARASRPDLPWMLKEDSGDLPASDSNLGMGLFRSEGGTDKQPGYPRDGRDP